MEAGGGLCSLSDFDLGAIALQACLGRVLAQIGRGWVSGELQVRGRAAVMVGRTIGRYRALSAIQFGS